ncbi:MAG: formimidoylglutamase [Winogradskyella sp.]|uniref:formimidoylglutamase n=1 Tax=Winogradskyella sp. TaxID=1883156 RepID=UPI001834CC9B|nr:formimidoylglutamase [Winogradskyella sp.]MBT8245173.1 formimidoylglutamase [Winogradskyella sp.]NNK22622.1 formimidoylglutamase [Winogradskyella sp.]
MQNLIQFTSKDRDMLVKTRKGETKFGEHVQLNNNFTNIYDDIKALDVDYVIFGISEDIGVVANHGKSGTYKAWNATVKVLLNTQSNTFIDTKRILVLGYLNYSEQREQLKDLELSKKKRISLARKLTEQVDSDVSHLVFSIINAGKIPIIIGGGHNNAYGNIKGASLAYNTSINAINFDAHHDFRPQEGRHSGNGFRYAYNEGFLKNYFIFGLHENYISQNSLDTLNSTKGVVYNTFEDVSVRKRLGFKSEIKRALDYVNTTHFGLEIDCDAIEDIPSSAMTPSGFSVTKVRRFISKVAIEKNVSYLHICEAAPTKNTEAPVGKLISYLITDFIKAHANSNN